MYSELHSYTFEFLDGSRLPFGRQTLKVTHRLPDRELYDRAAGYMPDGTKAVLVSENGEEIFRMRRVTEHGWKVTGADGYDHLYTT